MTSPIFICRTETPALASNNPITIKEWKNIVRDIPQMHMYEGPQALPPYIAPPSPSEGLARWSGHPLADVIWLNYRDGAIRAESYDAYVCMRMRTLANRLGARVIDENGRRF